MGILQILLVGLKIVSGIMDMFTKAQADKEAEIRVTSKVRKKVDDATEKVKKKLADKYPDFINRK